MELRPAKACWFWALPSGVKSLRFFTISVANSAFAESILRQMRWWVLTVSRICQSRSTAAVAQFLSNETALWGTVRTQIAPKAIATRESILIELEK